jgi:hypothetical protein
VSIPSATTGAGNNSSAKNVYRVVFSQALSSNPQLEAWDDSTFSSTAKEMFAGTGVNGHIPYMAAVATTDSAPLAAWKPAPVGGGATINRLKGLTNFVTLSTVIPTAGGNVRFNLNWEIPSDATIPSINTLNGVLAVRISFSGATPVLTWQFNDNSAGGTEGAPVWTNITPGSAGNFIKPSNNGATSSTVFFTIPLSGVSDAPAQWVTNT